MGVLDELVSALRLAGRYREEAKADPACARGWLKMAAKHSARAELLADRLPRMGWEDAAGVEVTAPSRRNR